jgi:hypothetical protein
MLERNKCNFRKSKLVLHSMKTIIFLFLSISCIESMAQNFLNRCNETLINTIIGDIFSPPVASRLHAYPNIAAYQILALNNPTLPKLEFKLKDFKPVSLPTQIIDCNLAAEKAFCFVAKTLIYTESKIENFEEVEYNKWLVDNANDTTLKNNSIEYGTQVGKEIVAWMKQDNYGYTRTLMRYVLVDSPYAWKPTPPEYMNGLEPNWHLMRSFLFDTFSMIKPLPNVDYSEAKKSLYYKNALALMKAKKKLNANQIHIARFWDDNPNTSISNGHLTYFIHKATPGGHWLKIAGKACIANKYNEAQTAKVYTAVALGLYEGFLSCWTEKYKSNTVRPETYINRRIDPYWKPLIETPPFPEYTSGHSVISAASSSILTALIPQPYSFSDSSVKEYGIEPRSFKSFVDASNEASISRFYGGIHYMPALTNGTLQGKEIGEIIIKMLFK